MSVVTKIGSEVGAYENYAKINTCTKSLLISTQKLYFSDNDPVYYVIIQEPVLITDMISEGIHLLNTYSFRHTQSFSFLDKSAGPI